MVLHVTAVREFLIVGVLVAVVIQVAVSVLVEMGITAARWVYSRFWVYARQWVYSRRCMWGYMVQSLGKRNTSHAVMVKAGWQGLKCVLLPLQSTNEQMHAIRMIDIGRHKQPAMDIWLLQEHVLTSEQAIAPTKLQQKHKVNLNTVLYHNLNMTGDIR